MSLVHATVVCLDGKGVMITGPSGSGKSDLALRLIMDAGAVLIGDDYVTLAREGDRLVARPAEKIAGMIEVRGIGLVHMANLASAAVDLVLTLPERTGPGALERLPEEKFFEHEGIRVRRLDFLPFEASALAKVRAALAHFLS